MARVEIRNLGLFQNNRWLFRNLTVDVEPGSFVAVVGPSGVGKTSLLACLAGMRNPTEGCVHFCAEDGKAETPRCYRRKIGIIFQQFLLTENETVLNNVLYGRLQRYCCLRTFFGFPRAEKEHAHRLICDLGLTGYAHRYAARISGGEKQRVAVARALFQEPEVFLADEPVSQLDSYLTGRILGLLKLEVSQAKRTVFCVLHNAELVNRFADYALSLNSEKPGEWSLRAIA